MLLILFGIWQNLPIVGNHNAFQLDVYSDFPEEKAIHLPIKIDDLLRKAIRYADYESDLKRYGKQKTHNRRGCLCS